MCKKISCSVSKEKQKIVEEKIIGKDVNINTFLIPKRFRDSFEIECIKEKPNEFNLILVGKKDLLPPEAQSKKLSLVGFLNPVEVISFPAWEKPVYIKYKRRRWRDMNTKKDYFNTYEFHPKGVKAVHEFANFLKELDREELDTIFLDWKSIRYITQEDFHLV